MYPVWFGKYLCQLHQKKLPWDETIEPFLCFFATRVPDSLLPTPGILWGISSWKDGSGWKLVARQRLKETAQETQSHLTNYKYFLLHGHHNITDTLKGNFTENLTDLGTNKHLDSIRNFQICFCTWRTRQTCWKFNVLFLTSTVLNFFSFVIFGFFLNIFLVLKMLFWKQYVFVCIFDLICVNDHEFWVKRNDAFLGYCYFCICVFVCLCICVFAYV